MTRPKTHPQQSDGDEALRQQILAQTTRINRTLIARFTTISDDLDAGRHRAALGGLDGAELQIDTLRSYLRLLP